MKILLTILLSFCVLPTSSYAFDYFTSDEKCTFSSDKEPVKTAYEYFNNKRLDSVAKNTAYEFCYRCSGFAFCMANSDNLTKKSRFYNQKSGDQIRQICIENGMVSALTFDFDSCEKYINNLPSKKEKQEREEIANLKGENRIKHSQNLCDNQKNKKTKKAQSYLNDKSDDNREDARNYCKVCRAYSYCIEKSKTNTNTLEKTMLRKFRRETLEPKCKAKDMLFPIEQSWTYCKQ